MPQFQAVIQDFLATAKHAGKTKIVIDLQSNRGGIISLGHDLFRQFFPQTQESAVTCWKNSDTYVDITRAISDSLEGFDPYAPGADVDKVDDYALTLNWRTDSNSSLQPFVSYEDKFGSHIYKNTPYTNLMAWDFNDSLISSPDHGLGVNTTGYGNRKNITQHCSSEDLVIIYDGYCSSTCTVASELFRITGNAKSVVMGGRPRAGPQQGVATDNNIKARLSSLKDLKLFRGNGRSNTRDQIVPEHRVDGVPSQFVATYSECRLYWTEPMLKDIQEVWKAAARSAFNGAKCNYRGIKRSPTVSRSEDIATGQGPAPVLLSRSLRESPMLASKSAAWKALFNVDVPKFEL
ncbi:hypothetical protein VHEMI08066 [[Torrubiella] hemipterigena]|uniref:Uncharacterized protein n=1 Tax=[Torrubiella] hemipterigena TaxID=1531966 RepID=A0A0A1T5G6_9HYPO|nr:hypothetical protein VHEMI08066 [[Torrubiella] hemipterigena]